MYCAQKKKKNNNEKMLVNRWDYLFYFIKSIHPYSMNITSLLYDVCLFSVCMCACTLLLFAIIFIKSIVVLTKMAFS